MPHNLALGSHTRFHFSGEARVFSMTKSVVVVIERFLMFGAIEPQGNERANYSLDFLWDAETIIGLVED